MYGVPAVLPVVGTLVGILIGLGAAYLVWHRRRGAEAVVLTEADLERRYGREPGRPAFEEAKLYAGLKRPEKDEIAARALLRAVAMNPAYSARAFQTPALCKLIHRNPHLGAILRDAMMDGHLGVPR